MDNLCIYKTWHDGFKVEIPMLQYSTDHISTATNCIFKTKIPSFEDPHIMAWMSLDWVGTGIDMEVPPCLCHTKPHTDIQKKDGEDL